MTGPCLCEAMEWWEIKVGRVWLCGASSPFGHRKVK